MATNSTLLPTTRANIPVGRVTVGGPLLAALAAALLVLLYHFQANTQFAAVLALLLGFTAVSAVRLLQSRPVVEAVALRRITFNETVLQQQIALVVQQVDPQLREPAPLPWDVQAHDLIGKDNALALAKLRLDLERELRRLIEENGLNYPVMQSMRYLAQHLVDSEVVPPEILKPLFEVSRVANDAIHGLDITTEVAASAVRIGEELVAILRSLPKQAA